MDDDFYAEKEGELWGLEEGHYDAEEGSTIMAGADFYEWRSSGGLTGLRPYETEAGELARWRPVLELNDLSRSFLVVDDYLGEPG